MKTLWRIALLLIICNKIVGQTLDSLLVQSEKLSTSKFDDAIELSNKGMTMAIKQKDSISLSKFFQNKGLAYYFKGMYDSASGLFMQSVQISSSLKHLPTLGQAYNLMGRVCRKNKKLDEALTYYNKAMATFEQQNDLKNIAMIYNESGVVYEYMKDYKEALRRYTKSLDMSVKLKDTIGIAYAYNFIAGIYTLQNRYDLAEKNLYKAIELNKLRKDTLAIALAQVDMVNLLVQAKQYAKASAYIDSSKSIASGMRYKELYAHILSLESDLAYAVGNTDKAFRLFKQHVQLKDSLFNERNLQQLNELNTKYKTKENELLIKEQEASISKKNYMIFGGLALFVCLAALSLLYYNRYKLKQKNILQQEIMKQQDLATKAVMEAEERERRRIASDLHDGVGQMLTAARFNLAGMKDFVLALPAQHQLIFENVVSMIDESTKEVRAVSHQIMPNSLVKAGLASAVKEFIDKIDNPSLKVNLNIYGLHEPLNDQVALVAYRIIQECVNNVIKHANASNLDISLTKDAKQLAITIEDNGTGFEPNNIKDHGIGLQNILSRVQLLKGSLDLDTSPGKGTLVAIHIPL